MRTLIAIPVFNEEKHVNTVLDEVRKYTRDILVIDDGSTDSTPLLLAKQPVEVVRHAQNRGYGRSMIDAFRWASCQTCNYDWLITMDCDEQHEPAALATFEKAIKENHVDVVSGSRYMPVSAGNGDNDLPPADRQAINAEMTRVINDRLCLGITDAFCGFKAYKVSSLRKLSLNESGYAFPMQFFVQAAANGLKLVEVPIRLIYNDPMRNFGGVLDDAGVRLAHYKQVFEREMARCADRLQPCGCAGK